MKGFKSMGDTLEAHGFKDVEPDSDFYNVFRVKDGEKCVSKFIIYLNPAHEYSFYDFNINTDCEPISLKPSTNLS